MRHGGRTFLEVQRLDRHGLPGRSPLVSLATLDACVVPGGSGDWPRLAGRQQAPGALGALDAAALQQAQGLASFGRLSHNADMRSGHLRFRPQAAAGAVAAGSGRRAAADSCISETFRQVCGGHADVLQGLAQRLCRRAAAAAANVPAGSARPDCN